MVVVITIVIVIISIVFVIVIVQRKILTHLARPSEHPTQGENCQNA